MVHALTCLTFNKNENPQSVVDVSCGDASLALTWHKTKRWYRWQKAQIISCLCQPAHLTTHLPQRSVSHAWVCETFLVVMKPHHGCWSLLSPEHWPQNYAPVTFALLEVKATASRRSGYRTSPGTYCQQQFSSTLDLVSMLRIFLPPGSVTTGYKGQGRPLQEAMQHRQDQGQHFIVVSYLTMYAFG